MADPHEISDQSDHSKYAINDKYNCLCLISFGKHFVFIYAINAYPFDI